MPTLNSHLNQILRLIFGFTGNKTKDKLDQHSAMQPSSNHFGAYYSFNTERECLQ